MQTNFNIESLLFNADITVKLDDKKEVKIKIPTLKEMNENLSLGRLVGILNTELEKSQEAFSRTEFEFETLQGLFIGLQLSGIEVETIKESLPLLIQGVSYTKRGIEVDDRPLEEAELQYIKDIILVGTGKLSFEEFQKISDSREETEIEKKQRENQERIDAIRKKEDVPQEESFIDRDKAMANILLMLPGWTLKDIGELNGFSFNWLHKFASAMITERFIVSAAGFGGLPKDYKFITEK